MNTPRNPAGNGASVCFIVQNQSFGGMEVHTLGLIDTLVRRGIAVELVSNRYSGYREALRAHCSEGSVRTLDTDLDGIIYGERASESRWARALDGVCSRVLIFPKGDCNFGHPAFLRACRRKFGQIVFIEHLEGRPRPASARRWLGIFPGLHLWWHRRRVLSRLGSRYADRIVAVSESVRQRLVNDYWYDPRKVVVVRNGVEWRKHARDKGRAARFREKYGIPDGAFVFGMLTRVEHQKGIDVALHAFQSVVEHSASADPYLVIAGEGTQLDMLRELARNLGIERRVRFIGFIGDPAEVLSGYDVILFSSRNEGLPLALLEGMAAGCIPIVTRVSGMPEAVDSPQVGCVVEPEVPEELAEAMRGILGLEEHALANMRKNVVERVVSGFDVAAVHDRILKLCDLAPFGQAPDGDPAIRHG